MIAIAGAKGGCGKTTTTLGLAAAFGRSGVQTLAVDADRQLPDLHVVAGVEREPTVAALDRETGWHALAQETPGATGAHVLPGQKPTESVELDAALEWLDAGATEVLLDCPSGAGPDVVEAIAVADGVVVVTTDSEQSLDAAGTTIDIARRLDVPIAGAVFTHCTAVPEAFHSRFEIPVLAVVPESESPLADDEARAEYDRAADELAAMTAVTPDDHGASDRQSAPATDEPTPADTAEESPTAGAPDERTDRDAEPGRAPSPQRAASPDRNGHDPADDDGREATPETEPGRSAEIERASGATTGDGAGTGTADGSTAGSNPSGGLTALEADLSALPPGSVAVVEAPPASQSEQLLYGLTAARGTLYVSTERTEQAVRAALETAAVPVGSPTVRYLTEDRLDETERLVGEVPDGSNVVVDPMASLERADRDDYREFANRLKTRMLETNSVAVLHCLSRPTVPENRATTKHVADAVFAVDPSGAGADRVSVRKFRSAGAVAGSVEQVLSGDGDRRRPGDDSGHRTEPGANRDGTPRPVRQGTDRRGRTTVDGERPVDRDD
ncbi:MinD/ParA family ATP-binding protein [Halosimplex salinum]|uniref:MinD/ParA family ATP-binding protein n=1 Tax=Halosimplex salinum TaxID=1710538 RepID=UPI000F4904A3|nr:MinD/ParA family protein [Halosimplex salinum]